MSGYVAYERLTFRPIGILGALNVPLFDAATLKFFGAVATLSTGSALLGLGYRFTAPTAAVLGLYLNWVVQSSGKLNHGGSLFNLVLVVIALSRAADAWSVDAWVRARRGRPRPTRSNEYTWPLRFIAVMVLSMYGAAGLSKLRVSGWEWGLSGALRLRLLGHHFSHKPPTRLGVWIADSELLSRALGFSAHLLELSSLLALLNRHAYRLVLPSLAFLQLSIWLTMGVLFKEMFVIFLCLLPWDAVISHADTACVAITRRLRAVRV